MRKLTTLQFITIAQYWHGGKYDLSQVVYDGNNKKIKIGCPVDDHGFFFQRPSDHKHYGCPKCGGTGKSNTENFIKKAKLIKNNSINLDYNPSNYINSSTLIEIICLIDNHGSFWQTPASHLRGHGCPKCFGTQALTQQEFIFKANVIHNNKYGYDCSIYINGYSMIKIHCPIHGYFEQRAESHLQGCGCPECGGGLKITKEKFLEKANERHNNFYGYTLSIIDGVKKKIKIECPNHGIFEQLVEAHLRGAGCPKCKSRVSASEIKWLDQLGIDIKYRQCVLPGISKRIKVDGFDPETNTVYEFHGDYWHGNPKKYNSDEINTTKNEAFGDIYQRTVERENLIKKSWIQFSCDVGIRL